MRGQLTIKGIHPPHDRDRRLRRAVEDPYGGLRAALELETTIDRRDYGMRWNAPLPTGGDALGTEVTLSVHLELVKAVYDEDVDVEPAPAPVARLREALAYADAVLIATPEYNRSVRGQLKNALDWARDPSLTTPCGASRSPIGPSTGLFGAVWAQAELRRVLAAIGARVVGEELPVGQAGEAFDAEGRLRDPALRAQVAGVIDSLADSRRTAMEVAGDEAEVDGRLATLPAG